MFSDECCVTEIATLFHGIVGYGVLLLCELISCLGLADQCELGTEWMCVAFDCRSMGCKTLLFSLLNQERYMSANAEADWR